MQVGQVLFSRAPAQGLGRAQACLRKGGRLIAATREGPIFLYFSLPLLFTLARSLQKKTYTLSLYFL
jgi:hypothetical protein